MRILRLAIVPFGPNCKPCDWRKRRYVAPVALPWAYCHTQANNWQEHRLTEFCVNSLPKQLIGYSFTDWLTHSRLAPTVKIELREHHAGKIQPLLNQNKIIWENIIVFNILKPLHQKHIDSRNKTFACICLWRNAKVGEFICCSEYRFFSNWCMQILRLAVVPFWPDCKPCDWHTQQYVAPAALPGAYCHTQAINWQEHWLTSRK